MVETGERAFEIAAEHASRSVPVVNPVDTVASVRESLIGRRYESAGHVVVCEGERFVGIVRIEELLAAAADATVGTVMDREPPVVAPGVDQEVAAWRAVRAEAVVVALALPSILVRFDRDPAFASGPLATVVQDLLSILIYMGIAAAVLT